MFLCRVTCFSVSRVISLYFLCLITCFFPVFLFVPMLSHVFHPCILICSCANCITVPSCLSAHLCFIEKLSCTKLYLKLVHCLFMICQSMSVLFYLFHLFLTKFYVLIHKLTLFVCVIE